MTVTITLIMAVAATVIGGLILMIVEQKIFKPNYNSKTNKEHVPNNSLPDRVLTNEIVDKIGPERNYEKVKEILGVPDKVVADESVFDSEFPFDVFSEDELKNITSDIYFLENAVLKVTTIDKQSIHALTVLSYDKLLLPDIPHYCNEYGDDLTDAKVCQELVDNSAIGSIRTIRDSAIALRTYMGPPFYKHMTYFIDGYLEDEENPDESELIGSPISGFCLSDSKMVFYIYDYDLR